MRELGLAGLLRSKNSQNRTYGCASSEGWCVQQEIDLPGKESETP